ncbi:MAG: MMPL family transporter [bacterium]|nr:MMPL family transporter [bacterium]
MADKRKRLISGLAASIIIFAAIGLRFISFDNNIELMLPANPEILRSMRFLRDSNLSDKVVLSLKLKSSEHTTHDLIQAVDQLEKSLKPPLITDVISGVSKADLMQEMHLFMRYVPQLLNEHDLSKIDRQITSEGVKTSLSRDYQQLLTPGSGFVMPFIRSDPLGIKSGFLSNIQKLSSSLGYKVQIKDGHFISQNGRNAMLILKTPVRLTDGFGSKNLIEYLHKQLKSLPEFISADIIAGHVHTVSNEYVMKKDILLTLTIASVAFLLLFLFIFRDIRAILIFLIPLISVLVSINLSAIILGKLSYFIIGMGAVIAGIAIDYGIHVYLAVRTGAGRPDAVKKIIKPVIIAAFTTIGVFAAFFFSSVQGYHQLALFSILSIILCLVCALFVLPYLLTGKHYMELPAILKQGSSMHSQVFDRICVACWGVIIIAAIALSWQVEFNSDISQLDGSKFEVIQTEQEFHNVWGGADKPAILVTSGENLEEALQCNERIYTEAVNEVGEDNFAPMGFTSFAELWLSNQTRIANSARWNKFWREGREAKLKELLQEHGQAYHFSDDAFSPFFKNLYTEKVIKNTPEGLTFFDQLKERFVLKKADEYQVLSFFPDKDKCVKTLSAIISRYPRTFLVSRNAFSSILSQAVSSEVIFLSVIAVLLILILTCLLLRNIRLTVLALIPVITGILLILGIIPVFGLSLNAPCVIAGIIVIGLCIDYGIFMVYTCEYNLKTGTRMAVSLSALTTVIGAGALLFALHPVLFSIGLTLVIGVVGGYISALLVIPSLYRLWQKPKKA